MLSNIVMKNLLFDAWKNYSRHKSVSLSYLVLIQSECVYLCHNVRTDHDKTIDINISKTYVLSTINKRCQSHIHRSHFHSLERR